MLGVLNNTRGDYDGEVAARAWWTVCMGARLQECRKAHDTWKQQVEDAALPNTLTVAQTQQAVALPAFEPLARCVTLRSMEVGVEPGPLLDRMQAQSKLGAITEWSRAVRDVVPLRERLQAMLPMARVARLSWLQRAVGSRAQAPAGLAPSAAEMDIDEVRLCQVWMYGVASRLSACRGAAGELAAGVGMSDPNQPLQGYESRRWDPTSPTWREMEACVHLQAAKAGTVADAAWRA